MTRWMRLLRRLEGDEPARRCRGGGRFLRRSLGWSRCGPTLGTLLLRVGGFLGTLLLGGGGFLGTLLFGGGGSSLTSPSWISPRQPSTSSWRISTSLVRWRRKCLSSNRARRPWARHKLPVRSTESLWVVLEVNEHARQVGRELVERHGPVDMALLTLGAPDDALIRHLIHDLRRPGTMRPEDLCLPLERHIIFLFDVFDLLHEIRELRELSPCLVRDTARERGGQAHRRCW